MSYNDRIARVTGWRFKAYLVQPASTRYFLWQQSCKKESETPSIKLKWRAVIPQTVL